MPSNRVTWEDVQRGLAEIQTQKHLSELQRLDTGNPFADIQEKLGSTKYPRLRIGVGSNFSKGRQADYVLSNWKPDEQSKLPLIVDQAAKAVIHFATQGLEQTMNLYNGHAKVNKG